MVIISFRQWRAGILADGTFSPTVKDPSRLSLYSSNHRSEDEVLALDWLSFTADKRSANNDRIAPLVGASSGRAKSFMRCGNACDIVYFETLAAQDKRNDIGQKESVVRVESSPTNAQSTFIAGRA